MFENILRAEVLLLNSNQNIKEHIPAALEVFDCFEKKSHKQILLENNYGTCE